MTASTPIGFDYNNLPLFFKTLFPGGLVKALSLQDSPWRARLNMSDTFGGASVKEVPMQYALPQARSRNALIAIQQRNSASTKLAQWTMKAGFDYATFVVKYADILRARDNKMAFGKLQQMAMTSTLGSLNDSINRSLWRDGTGSIGQVVTTGTPLTTVTLTTDTLALQSRADAFLFEVGMSCQFFNSVVSTVPTLLGSGESHNVIAVDTEAGKVQFDFNLALVGNGGVTNSTYILAQGDGQGYGSTTEDGVIVGAACYLPITAPTAGDNLWGQDRSPYPTKLAGHRANATSKVLWDEIQRMTARIMRFKGKPDTCYMAPEQLQNLIIGRDGLTENFRQTMSVSGDDGDGGTMTQEIGFSGVRILTPNGSIECFGDSFCPPDRVYLIQQNTWELQTMGEFPHMVTLGNQNGMQQEPDAFAAQCRYFASGQLVCTAPAFNGVLQVTPVN